MRRDVLRAAALALFVAGVVCIAYGRTSAAAWRVPIDYYGDSWPALAPLKVAAEGHLAPPLARGGARARGALRRGLERLTSASTSCSTSWPEASCARSASCRRRTCWCLLAAALAASSFYFVCRSFRARPEWALAGGTAFALSPYFFYRGLSHLTLTLLLAPAARGAGGDLGLRPPRLRAALAPFRGGGRDRPGLPASTTSTTRGCSRSSWRSRPSRARCGRGVIAAAAPPLVLLVLLLASVVADNANVVIAAWSGAPTSAMDRPYGSLERYALKPIELLLPISHGWGLAPWASLGAVYFRSALYRGEMGAAYLGLAGVLGLVCLSAVASRQLPAPAEGVRAGCLPGGLLHPGCTPSWAGSTASSERWASSGSAPRTATASGS